ncbi:multidrug transporter subunit MdtD [Uliginosibacterium sp. sgz301328]|uniref:multidrug transporter subunit MdtD n=1 Tax=Uliginosibacterium sp. sgz301328 TaxID=3243764 RepID=UPI00359EB134
MEIHRDHRPLLWLVAVGLLMQMLDSTIVNTALPSIATDLKASPLKMEMVVIGYMLTVALLMPASGWVADRFGIRRVYLCAIALFTLGSVLCAESRTLEQLVGARVVQGVGGAFLMPVGRLAVLRTVSREELLAALSFVALPALIGPLLGPFVGGWLSESISWHWIFLINVPIGLAGIALTFRLMPVFPVDKGQPFDFRGYGMFALAIALISLALEGLGELGLSLSLAMLLMVAGAGLLGAYWLHATRFSLPLFSPRLFRINSYSVGLLGNLFARIGSGGIPFLLPLMFQIGMEYSPLQSGLMMIPSALASLLSRIGVGRVIGRFGYRKVLTVNTLLVGLMIMSMALVPLKLPLWLVIVQLFIFGFVNGLQFTAMNTVALQDLPAEDASSGNTLLSVIMQLAISMGVGASAALLNGFVNVFETGDIISSFQATFCTVGLMGMVAAAIFLQLSGDRRDVAHGDVPMGE